MHKPCGIHFKRFTSRLTEINNFLPLLPSSEASKKIPPEDLNEILPHEVTSVWAKQYYLRVRDFEEDFQGNLCHVRANGNI